jgi:hypothetical protein
MGQKGVTKHFKQPRLALAAGPAEGVNRRADHDIDETALLKLRDSITHMTSSNTR